MSISTFANFLKKIKIYCQKGYLQRVLLLILDNNTLEELDRNPLLVISVVFWLLPLAIYSGDTLTAAATAVVVALGAAIDSLAAFTYVDAVNAVDDLAAVVDVFVLC